MLERSKGQEYTELEATKELLARCRTDIVCARLLLASFGPLPVEQTARLWHVIEANELFIIMLAEDYRWQLEQIDRELERKLQGKSKASSTPLHHRSI